MAAVRSYSTGGDVMSLSRQFLLFVLLLTAALLSVPLRFVSVTKRPKRQEAKIKAD